MEAHKFRFLLRMLGLTNKERIMSNKSLFDYTLGKKAEDTTSAVLAYILVEKKCSVESDIIRNLFGLESKDYKCNRPQDIIDGRFDLTVESYDQLIIVENKLGARFTWNKDEKHQLARYSEWLSKQNHKQNRSLIVLCPQKREAEIIRELDEHVKERHLAHIVTWEKICKGLLDNKEISEITQQLIKFIEQRYIIDIQIEKEGLEMIMNKVTGEAYYQLMKIINVIYSRYDNNKIVKKLEFNKDAYFYGFEFEESGITYFLGIWPEIWVKTGSPLIIQQTNGQQKSRFETVSAEDYYDGDVWIYCFQNLNSPESIEEELHSLLNGVKPNERVTSCKR